MIIAFLVLVVLIVAIIGWFISSQRNLVRLDENCKNALSQIEVQLMSRWDALLQLAKTASKYAEHESQTLINTIQARRQGGASTAEAINAQQGELSQVMGRLMAIGEAYPELKASELFVKTMDSVNSYEQNVRLSRMVYNDTATKMNRAVRMFPGSIAASMMHFGTQEYLKVDNEQKRDMPDLF